MKSLSVVAAATVFIALLAFGVVPRAFANDMNAVLVPERNKAEAHFIGVKNIEFRYPSGSALASQFGEKDTRIKFTIEGGTDSTDSGVINALAAFNKGFIDAGSPAQATSIKLTYTAVVKPGPASTLVSFKIEAAPTLEKFVLSRGAEQDFSGEIVDAEWRGVLVKEPIVVNAPELGEMEISRPIGLLEKIYPDLAAELDATAAAEILDEPILDFRRFNQSMDTWHFLFDPSGSLVESSAFFREESGAKVVSIYSLGESSFREGTFEAEEKDVEATVRGTKVQIHSQVPAPSGQIQIAGFANTDTTQKDSEFFAVTKEAPEGVSTATGGFPIQVLLVFGGMMGAIAVFILWKSRK
ncbi:hypothetical protein [Nitrososphaera sp.]|uniref:hypothetical protein n=1 Tax=Nitrososphaera sp. TaxID=1971748 RepID=UPI00307D4BFC